MRNNRNNNNNNNNNNNTKNEKYSALWYVKNWPGDEFYQIGFGLDNCLYVHRRFLVDTHVQTRSNVNIRGGDICKGVCLRATTKYAGNAPSRVCACLCNRLFRIDDSHSNACVSTLVLPQAVNGPPFSPLSAYR